MSLSEKDLDGIRDRVDRNSLPQGDRARLLADVERLRSIITGQIDAACREWLEEGDTDALARAEHWRNLLDPTEGES